MNSTVIILFIIALAGVVSASITYAKKLADQVPELLESFAKARAAWEDFKKGDGSSRPELPPANALGEPESPPGEPPMAA
ncbi:hypothetical protein ABT147_18545 [Streptomyces sp. NPDC001868]|uniref:hypothetical protein n=1 Tax=Streptomyces sp. NPDC001868 TaxID=3154401 RepID=UPI003317FAAF